MKQSVLSGHPYPCGGIDGGYPGGGTTGQAAAQTLDDDDSA